MFLVYGLGHSGRFEARHPGGAVRQFARIYGLTLRSDRDTGGWHDVHVEPVTPRIRRRVMPLLSAAYKTLVRRWRLTTRYRSLWKGTRGEGAEIVAASSLGTA